MTGHPVATRLVAVGVALVLVGAAVASLNLTRASQQAALDLASRAVAGPIGIEASVAEGAEGAAGGLVADSPSAVTGTPSDVGAARPLRPTGRVDAAWLARTAQATGIPSRALLAYASAHLTITAEDPACGLGWNTLAGIGAIESDHGRHGGAVLGEDGYPNPAIRGIPLDGTASAAIRDTDGGAWDGDAVWDRAVGPLQFIPGTWERWGADGNGDGSSDPNQIDDAALAAAGYLCASGPMTSPAGWRAAIFGYNHLDSYVDAVAAAANRFAVAAGG